MSTPNIPNAVGLHAAGRIVGGTGAQDAGSQNIVSVVHTGAGDYLVTMAQPIDQASRHIDIQPVNVAGRSSTVVDTSATVFQVLTWDLVGPAAQDTDFYFEVRRRHVP